ncbi:MAG: HEPN domain-containing protein [Anaerolineales bacterium]
MGYTFVMVDEKENYRLYLENADETLNAAQVNFEKGFYRSACNRAYYAMFYAASALLYSKGKSYGKHSAVLAAFRQLFIKTGEFDQKWSADYGEIMNNRHVADYELQDDLEEEDALNAIEKSKMFVQEVKQWLQKHELL